jgi:hypothetical protein
MPDELDVVIRQRKEVAETEMLNFALRTAISLIPYAGGAINEITGGLAQRRVQERLSAVFDALKDRLHSLGEEKVDREYFHSEEFQSLLYLLLEKLHTTHDKEKLRMFGNALGNSGNIDFRADDKEQYARILRDLALSDIKTLNHSLLTGWTPHISKIEYPPDVLSSLSRLQAMGLVQANQRPANSIAAGAFFERMTPPLQTTYSLTSFGTRFLLFISESS